jgi:hypothetical protein
VTGSSGAGLGGSRRRESPPGPGAGRHGSSRRS